MNESAHEVMAFLVAVLAAARGTTAPEDTEPQCAQCDTTYTPTRSDSRYCGSRCRQAAYRARKGLQ